MANGTYTVFKRSVTSWRQFATARKITEARNITLDQARRMCDEFNNHRTPAQIRRGTKLEFTS